jgi:hypothetical protein
MAFGLVTGFTDHLEIITTSNYSAIANSHTLQFTTACTKPSECAASSPVIAWLQLPVADFPLTIPVPQLPASNRNISQWMNWSSLTNSPTNSSFPCLALTRSLIVLLITSQHRPHRKHHSSIAVQFLLSGPHGKHRSFVAVHWCTLVICCLAVDFVYRVIT